MDHQFWIDVGGTFTDCLQRLPDGALRRAKVLSSGATKGTIASVAGAAFHDPHRRHDPPHFWRGFTCTLQNDQGEVVASSQVQEFEVATQQFQLADDLAAHLRPGQTFELSCDLAAPIIAIRWLLGLPLAQPLPPVAIRLGTTRGTNALLTRRGARTAFVTTRGFGDILRIGYQNRPKLFDLNIRKPTPLFAATVEIDERVAADGTILQPLDQTQARKALEQLRDKDIDSLAICLLHAYRQPQHEQQLAAIARELGFDELSLSHQVSPLIKLVARGDTTVVDAYLNPVLRQYVAGLRASLHPDSDLRLLTSAGGLVLADDFQGKDSILSGPAGGVVGFSRAALAAGFSRAIGFDMGGTSTDVARFDGHYEMQYETEKAGVRVVSPMLAIHTVAAGGGSLCWFDGVKLCVGPDSAGARPGPACYGGGGPLTVTDCNFLLGKIVPSAFPFQLSLPAVEARLQTLIDEIATATGQRYAPPDLAAGFLAVANANMAQAIRSVSTAQGYDPRDYALVAFGGAAAQHACAIATELGMTQILNHPDAGLLSAYGMGLADVTQHAVRGIYCPLAQLSREEVEQIFAELTHEATQTVLAQDVPEERITTRCSLDLRYVGTDVPLTIESPTDSDFATAFAHEHRRRYGYVHAQRALEVVAARVEVIGRSSTSAPLTNRVTAKQRAAEQAHPLYFSSLWLDAGLFERTQLTPGDRLTGPAIISELASTTIIDPHWQAEVLAGGELLLTHSEVLATSSDSFRDDPEVQLMMEVRNGNATAFENLVLRSQGRLLKELERLVGDRERAEDLAQEVFLRVYRARATYFPRERFYPWILSIAQTVAAKSQSSPSPASHLSLPSSSPDPVQLEIFNHHFAGIAERMGITLRNTSSSVNVKERLDFSCALFTASGDLVVNAPHIPVHLGAMSETVKQLLASHPQMQPGDVYVTNDPYRGGSHLPDVTVVTPVHDPHTHELQFFTASRAHHAEIGGITPGSMPPFSKCLAEEGVLIRDFLLVEQGQSRFDELAALLASGSYPSRDVASNLADIAAQVAANQQGVADLRSLVARYSWPVVADYMRHIQDAAERKVRAALAQLPDGERRFDDHLDDGTPIAVTITIVGDAATIDFTGSGPVSRGNLNANRAIVTAAVMYVLRLLLAEEIPLNQGVLAPVTLILPIGILNPPAGDTAVNSPAVVGGNVETSQRVVDVLLGALDLAAASQGTMNNLLFGDETFGYYETICGGSGATSFAPGADAVHTHMTNTRLTDPEVLELRYPVRLHAFGIRADSGGAGEHQGGNGVTRTIEFLRQLRVSILSQRRRPYAPYGLHGGSPGALGEQTLDRADGTRETLPHATHFVAHVGDRLTIQTPGGGAWGTS